MFWFNLLDSPDVAMVCWIRLVVSRIEEVEFEGHGFSECTRGVTVMLITSCSPTSYLWHEPATSNTRITMDTEQLKNPTLFIFGGL